MRTRHHFESRQGSGRTQNEDSVFIDVRCNAYAVADGLGGMPAGDLASRTAVAAIQKSIIEQGCETLDDMNEVVEQAHRSVIETGRRFVGSTIATTLTLAHLKVGRLHVAHVGDSFALVVRDGRGIVLTEEHTWEHSRRHILDLAPFSEAFRHSLTRALGANIDLQVDVDSLPINTGDRLLLATDGISAALSPAEMVDIIQRGSTPEATTDRLCTTAVARGSTDDVTAIMIFIDAAD